MTIHDPASRLNADCQISRDELDDVVRQARSKTRLCDE